MTSYYLPPPEEVFQYQATLKYPSRSYHEGTRITVLMGKDIVNRGAPRFVYRSPIGVYPRSAVYGFRIKKLTR